MTTTTPIPAPASATARRSVRVGGAAVVLAASVVMLLAQTPLLWKFFLDLWSRPQYEFFPLLLAGVPFVAVVCLRDVSLETIRPGRLGGALVLWPLAWVCLAVGGAMYLKWFAPVSTWLMLVGIAWMLGGVGLLRAMWPVGVLLLLILPPPGQYDNDLLILLRRLAVTCAGRLLDALHVTQYVHGAVIDVPGDRLMVEEACSGINSMLAVLAFTVLLAFWKRLPPVSLIMLLPAAFVFVFWANVLRITVCAAAKVWWAADLLTGTPHELFGLLLFVGCMALVFSTVRLGEGLFRWEDSDQTHDVAAPPARAISLPEVNGFRTAAWVAAAVVFAVTGGFVGVRTWKAWPASTLPSAESFRMPAVLAGWTQVNDKNAAPERAEVSGRQSHLWQYRRGSLVATVGFDYPFVGYHDATTCYSMAGWQVTQTVEHPPREHGPARFDVAMVRPPLSDGTLAFALCDENGVWWQRPPPQGTESRLALALRLSRTKALAPPLVQMQVLRVGYQPPSEEERAALADLFDAAAADLTQQLRHFRSAPK